MSCGTAFIDPSGYVYDKPSLTLQMTQTVPGAMVTLYRMPGWSPKQYPGDDTPYTCQSHLSKAPEQVWDQALSEQELLLSEMLNQQVQQELKLTGQHEISPTINPEYADRYGHYAWDVVEGCWYVTVHAKGYEPYVSPVVGVPPAVTDLHAALVPYNYLTVTQQMRDVNGGELAPGDVLRYSIWVTNTSGITQTNTVVEHSVPLGVTLAGWWPPGAITDTNPIRWSIGDMLPGAAWSGVVTATVHGGAALVSLSRAGTSAALVGDSWAAVESEEDRKSTEVITYQPPSYEPDTTHWVYLPLVLRNR